MPLQKKSILFLAASLIVSIVILFGTASIILTQSYSKLESFTAKQNVERVEKAIGAIEDQLKSTIIDWSYWDETYDFISNKNQDYIDSNLQDNTLAYLKINLIQYVDANGKVIFTKAIKIFDHGTYPVDVANMDFGKRFPLLINAPEEDPQRSGVILLDNRLLLILSSPVIHSDVSGPRNGTLLMGRYIDLDFIETLAQQTNTDITIFPFPPDETKPDILKINKQLENGVVYPSQVIDKNLYAGYTYLRDVNGSPTAIVQVSFPRDIFKQGTQTLFYLFSILSILVLIVLLVFYFLLDRIFFKPIMVLSQDVRHINELRQPDARIQSIDGNDEISALGKNINGLLSTLDEIQESYRTLIVNQGEGLTIVDENENITFANPAAESIYNVAPGTLVGRNINEFLNEEDKLKVKKETGLRKQGVKSTYEISLHRDDGKTIPVLITANPKYDAAGNYVATYGIFRDISDLKHAQQVLVESESKFRSFIEQSQVGIILLGEDGNVIEWNPSLEQLTGLKSR